MANVPRVSGNAIISLLVEPVMEMMKDVIDKEDNRQILQTDFRPMEILLQYTGIIFRDQQKDPPEMVKIWLQLLQNSLAEAKGLFDRSRPRQSCLDCVACKPGRLSKEIRDWNAFFYHLYQGLQSDLFQHIVLSGNAIISHVVNPIIELLKDVIKEEDSRRILRTDLKRMENLLLDLTNLFRDEPDITTLFQSQKKAHREIVNRLQSLQTSLIEAKRRLLIDRSGLRQSCTDRVVCNPRRLSRQIRDWNASFDQIYHGFQSELSILVTSLQFLSSNPLHIEEKAKEPAVIPHLEEKAKEPAVIPHLEEKAKEPILKRRQKSIQPIEGSTEGGAHSSDEEEAEESIEEEAEGSAEEGRGLSRDEGWRLFRTVAFKDDQVSMDIQDRARRFADECKGMPLAINIVGAMISQTSVDDWDTCFSLIKRIDPSFPATHPRLDAQLYRLLRWCFDALPNSNVKNCFLYCALYMENQDQEIDSRDLVEMWIGEGLVKSKQGTYLMDMVLGRKYLKLLLDRCFCQIVHDSTNVFTIRKSIQDRGERAHDVIPSIRVPDVIREMAMYIAQKEENCLLMTSQNLRNFPEVHNNNCRRISLANNFIEDLPTDLRCPELASLILNGNKNLKELPSDFLLSLAASLRVLNLSGCTEITSLPTSMGQLKLLEFLSLSELPIKDLPEEICNLSRLQFLNLSNCLRLESLPSKIAELKNLKCLNLDFCSSLRVIPHDMSELTSLSRLQLYSIVLSVHTEAPASIWSLKGLKILRELDVWIYGIQDGIIGTWSEMRHLRLSSFSLETLPEDMESMKKLQSFILYGYLGLSLPNCKFEHLEMVSLTHCPKIRELSPLEWMPNLKLLKLRGCRSLTELGIGNGGRVPSGYQRLEKLVLRYLKLESLGRVSNTGVWDERTLPHLRVLKIRRCPSLKRFPIGMDKLPNLCALIGEVSWWRNIMWENDDMKISLEKKFTLIA